MSVNGPEDLGGAIPAGAAMAVWGDFEVEVFAVLEDGQMWNRYWDGSDWHVWEPMGSPAKGRFVGRPAAAARDADRIDVFGIDDQGAVHHRFWDGSAWVPWQQVTGAPAGATDVSCAWGSDGLHLGVVADGSLWHLRIIIP